MLNTKKQINKMGVKKQETKVVKKVEPKKKAVNKSVVYECLCCSHRTISVERPTTCACSNPNYVINTQYVVGD